MARIEHTIDVNVPVGKVYSQWTRFPQFPAFMEAVKRVQVLHDGRLEWTAEIAGQERGWTAEIYEQEPDRVIAWRSTGGEKNAGRVTFQELDLAKTRITLAMEWSPDGVIEKAGDALGFDDRQVRPRRQPPARPSTGPRRPSPSGTPRPGRRRTRR
jgi:uncharacterized membrane protein